jgi:hypothetical protein
MSEATLIYCVLCKKYKPEEESEWWSKNNNTGFCKECWKRDYGKFDEEENTSGLEVSNKISPQVKDSRRKETLQDNRSGTESTRLGVHGNGMDLHKSQQSETQETRRQLRQSEMIEDGLLNKATKKAKGKTKSRGPYRKCGGVLP